MFCLGFSGSTQDAVDGDMFSAGTWDQPEMGYTDAYFLPDPGTDP